MSAPQIVLTKHGDRLHINLTDDHLLTSVVEVSDNTRDRSYGGSTYKIGTHSCGGGIFFIIMKNAKSNVIICRHCYLRIVVPKKVHSFRDLRKYLGERLRREIAAKTEIMRITDQLSQRQKRKK